MYSWDKFNIEIIDVEDFDDEGNSIVEDINTVYCSCPKCFSKTNQNTLIVNKKEEEWFCVNCSFAGNLIYGEKILPIDLYSEPWSYNLNLKNFSYVNNLSQKVIDNFSSKKISLDTLNHFKISQGLSFSKFTNSFIQHVIYPYYQNDVLVNLIYSNKNKHSEIGGLESCFNYDSIDEECTYFVLNELEVFSFYETGIKNVISFFGANNVKDVVSNQNKFFEFLNSIESKISNVKKIIIALPNSEITNVLKDELLRRLGKERCWVVQPPEVNYSWNQVLIDYGTEKFLKLLDTAKPIPVRGIFEIDDIEEQFDDLYHKGLRKGYSTGFTTVDQFYTVVPGQWTVLTGIPGHGKSNFLDGIMVNLAKNHDWRFALFSPENQPIARHFAGIMEKYYAKPFDIGKVNRINEEEKEEGKKWLKRHFSVILPHEDDSWSIDGILELAKVLVFRKGIRGLVIDPWNEIDHSRPNNQTETEYVSAVLTKIRQFARNMDVHVWLVAHPAKLYKDKDGKYPVPTPYDISGSAHYRNKADNAVTVWRNVGYEDQSVADIHIQKIRFKEVGRVGLCSLRFDSNTNSLVDDIDQFKRQQALDSGEVVPTEKLRIKESF
jgi:twinkle protein